MCEIVGALSTADVVPFLLDGLKTLEYRGYDSAGLALVNESLIRVRAMGRVSRLEAEVAKAVVSGGLGIAHTRWATHGAPAERNAHPHVSGGLAVVHNGIIENHEALRRQLESLGYTFSSETDTETIAHLIQACLDGKIGQGAGDVFTAVQHAVTRLQGAYALAVIRVLEPDRMILAREGSPLMLGRGENGYFAASDASALVAVTRDLIYLENGDVACVTPGGVEMVDRQGRAVVRAITRSAVDASEVALGQFDHYMQKEIFEQPRAIANTLELLAGDAGIQAEVFGNQAGVILNAVDSVLILACGTSYYSGLTAAYWLEAVAGLPCKVEVASEYRYRISVARPSQLVVVISQSGETADTMAALEHAKAQGHCHTLAICNVPESSLVRATALSFITRAGPEIGVASTKAFTTQLSALFVLTLLLARAQNALTAEAERNYLNELRHLPVAVQKVLDLDPEIKALAQSFASKHHALFLGRGHHFPIALEGALKLKEISYIHAEAYPAGELKHGPLALVDADMPVIVVAPADSLLEKLKANMQEVRARGGQLYVFADANSQVQAEPGISVLRLPEHYGLLSPVLHVVALQLLDYHVALVKGTDVDKPRNLAKSVTVE